MRAANAWFILFVVASGCGGGNSEEAVAKELEALAGSWKMASLEEGGKAVATEDLPAITFTVGPDGKATVQTPDGEFQTQSTVDPTKEPKTLDIEYLGGLLKGKKQYGIYKLDGNRWTVFSTPPGGKPEDRPSKFDSSTANGGLIVWERVEDDK